MNNNRKPFLSLKWKLLALMAAVFFVIAAGISWAAYLQQDNQQQRLRAEHQIRSSQELDLQIKSVQRELIRQAEYLVLMAGEDDQLLTSESLVSGITGNISRLMLSSGIEKVQVYSSGGDTVFHTGTRDPLLREVGERVRTTEQPGARLSCVSECRILVAVPVLLEGGVGSIALAASVADVVLRVHQTSGWDIGVLLNASEEHLADLPSWGLNLSALSNRQQLEPLLTSYTRKSRFHGQGQYIIETGGLHYEMALVPLTLLEEQQGYWVLLSDLSDTYNSIRNDNVQLLAITWLSLLSSALLLIAVIQPSLSGLSLVATVLPSLGRHEYEMVRRKLSKDNRLHRRYFNDELGLLAGSAFNLADELERLDREVKSRTLRLNRSSRELAKQREFVAGLLDNAEAVIVLQNRDGVCQSINQYGRLLISKNESQCASQRFEELFGPLELSVRERLSEVCVGLKNVYRHETRLTTADGAVRNLSWLHSRLRQRGRSDTVLSVGMDITEQKTVQHQLKWLASHDPLTELPNRTSLQRRLQDIVDADHNNEHSVAVLFCGLDHFKNINDTLGHPAGDKLLQQTAERMKTAVRNQDMVARWGSDEFVVLVNFIRGRQDAIDIASKLMTALSGGYYIEGQEVFVSASLGIALYPDDGLDSTTLVKHADVAMHQAKAEGRKQYLVYSPEHSAGFEERLSLDVDLRYAIERQELLLYYQPQLSADCTRVVGVEALLRWMHPDQGMIPPDRFIPLAEESGQIVEIGAWVLQEACRQLGQWRKQGMDTLSVSVNLTGPQIMDSQLLNRINKALDESGVPPSMLELEITESFAMERPESAISRLQLIKDLGIRLAIDDFGTGYSSLSYLKKLPVDKLKIDKSFVYDIGRYSDDEAIARAVIALGHSLNLAVIAEGVEKEEHVTFLRQNGCDEFQGYYFSRPLPADECTQYLHLKFQSTHVRNAD